MAVTKVQQMPSFKDDNGNTVEYERLTISGYVGGEIHTLEVKLNKSELMLAKMLLMSDEKEPKQDIRPATAKETEEHRTSIKKQMEENKISLDDDENEDKGMFD